MFGRRIFTLSITGLTCQNCVRHVTDALEKVPGVSLQKIDLVPGGTSTAKVKAGRSICAEQLCQVIADAGYCVADIS